ncbi:MAG: tRNA pseudouridine(38-40) synthase TruA, partial [Alistipes sp.]|nr:tRNA pseudouridine(38-40) synthase TruA [Alistipes sp.]
ICHISHAAWSVEEDGTLRFTIRADRFLRNMVRAIVGTLVDVGRGKYSPSDFEDIITSRDLSRASAGAPACGLFLSNVKYAE